MPAAIIFCPKKLTVAFKNSRVKKIPPTENNRSRVLFLVKLASDQIMFISSRHISLSPKQRSHLNPVTSHLTLRQHHLHISHLISVSTSPTGHRKDDRLAERNWPGCLLISLLKEVTSSTSKFILHRRRLAISAGQSSSCQPRDNGP